MRYLTSAYAGPVTVSLMAAYVTSLHRRQIAQVALTGAVG
jgi:hypothetical protein